MFFNSIAFAIFLPLVFVLYWALARVSTRWQNLFLLAASYVFYGWWNWSFLALLWISSAADYFIGLAIYKTSYRRHRRILLTASLIINLGILGFFKYFNFFVDSLQELLRVAGVDIRTATLDIILPVGISFYTFQTMSYTIDIYRGRFRPTTDAISFFAYVAFFPQLVAGPIERARHLLPQIQHRRVFSYDQAAAGLRFILWGLLKKIVIADGLAPLVDQVYGQPQVHQRGALILASFAFMVQIYADFSGYSDIAIGSARLFGFELSTNFRTPLFSGSFRELWQRWHISLSTWFRDYVYKSLGGGRGKSWRWIFILVSTFGLIGLWHGAALTFVVWGLVQGIFLSVETMLRKKLGRRLKVPPALGMAATITLFGLTSVFFRAQNITQSGGMIQRIIGGGGTVGIGQVMTEAFATPETAFYLVLSVALFLLIEGVIGKRDVNCLFCRLPQPVRWLAYYGVATWILLLGRFYQTPSFIYFQF